MAEQLFAVFAHGCLGLFVLLLPLRLEVAQVVAPGAARQEQLAQADAGIDEQGQLRGGESGLQTAPLPVQYAKRLAGAGFFHAGEQSVGGCGEKHRAAGANGADAGIGKVGAELGRRVGVVLTGYGKSHIAQLLALGVKLPHQGDAAFLGLR
ncbi:hypothetical protein, partial [Methylogaea oryzae]|uniref:hypothetical protein n=1 Tax=Methylogaea oryzae TaxID=1295382 RepID=UPI0012E20100